MAKETKEQRQAREAADIADLAKYKASIPARMVAVIALAKQIEVTTSITMKISGPEVHLFNGSSFDAYISYDTEEWELEYTERMLNELKAEKDATFARYTRAQEIFNNLSDDDKRAVKEHIYSLR